MTIQTQDILSDLKTYFKNYIVTASYELFISPLKLVSIDSTEIILATTSDWTKKVIERRFIDKIQLFFENLLESKVTIKIIINNKS